MTSRKFLKHQTKYYEQKHVMLANCYFSSSQNNQLFSLRWMFHGISRDFDFKKLKMCFSCIFALHRNTFRAIQLKKRHSLVLFGQVITHPPVLSMCSWLIPCIWRDAEQTCMLAPNLHQCNVKSCTHKNVRLSLCDSLAISHSFLFTERTKTYNDFHCLIRALTQTLQNKAPIVSHLCVHVCTGSTNHSPLTHIEK